MNELLIDWIRSIIPIVLPTTHITIIKNNPMCAAEENADESVNISERKIAYLFPNKISSY